MAKRNRRRKAHFKPANIGVAAMIAICIVPWALCSLMSLSSDQIATQVKLLEHEKRSLEESLRRHTAEWNQYIAPQRLDEAIARNGLKMSYAPPERTVRVAADGTMRISRQLSQQLAQERAARLAATREEAVASTAPTRRGTRRSRR